jgi:NAD(P)-dependent dehydrogenase (short-subunit alcohol dehydrogenase family)
MRYTGLLDKDSSPSPKTVLVTGASRGLGLAIARALDAADDVQLVLAVRDVAATEAAMHGLRRTPRVVRLDLASLDEVTAFIAAWHEPLWALVNNAGLQVTGPTAFTPDGFEQTIAVNHLASTWLALGLLPWLRGGRVMAIGSGTHNPESRTAALFGFRGGRFTSVEELAKGGLSHDATSDRQKGLDRYATSKLLVIATTMELARRHPATTFLTFDPGLMPGTGLVRGGPWYVRVAWNRVLRWLVPLMPDASTPERSASAARRLLAVDDNAVDVTSGEVYDFRARPSRRVWSGARANELGAAVTDQTIALLQARWPLPAGGRIGEARSLLADATTGDR